MGQLSHTHSPQTGSAFTLAARAIEHAHALLEKLGSIEVVSGKLRAGAKILNGDTDLVDAINSEHGFGCTIFLGSERIATTATAAGNDARAIGTYANSKITQMVLRSGGRFWGITRTIGKDWVIVYEPVRAHDGRIVGMLACYQELAGYLLDLSQLDGTPEGVIRHTADGQIVDLNLSACDMLGIERAVAIGSSLQDLTIGDLGLPQEDFHWPDSGEPVILERRWARVDGHTFPVEMRVGPVSGDPKLLVTVAYDVSDSFNTREHLKALNLELSELNQSLEERVVLRTQDLVDANDRLHQEMEARQLAQEELRRVHKLEAVGLLAAGIGHEINNPLSYVATNVLLAIMELDELPDRISDTVSDIREMLTDASTGVERISEVVQGIQNFSRLEAPVMLPVDINLALDMAIEMTGPKTLESLQIIRSIERGIPNVRGDFGQIYRVFGNLLSNACHAYADNTGIIRVSACIASGEFVKVTVSDNGCGMAEGDVLRAFDPFFTTKPIGSGTGLGLSICHGLITAMGGTIGIESVENQGTTVTILLNADATTAREAVPEQKEKAVQAKRVLVIDDEPMVLRGMTKSLTRLGLEVSTAASGQDGLSMYRGGDYALVLCDLMMPNFTGQDVSRELESMGSEHASKLVIVTGGAFTEEMMQFLDNCNVDVLTKPFSLKQLREVVNKHIPSAGPTAVA